MTKEKTINIGDKVNLTLYDSTDKIEGTLESLIPNGEDIGNPEYDIVIGENYYKLHDFYELVNIRTDPKTNKRYLEVRQRPWNPGEKND